MSGLIEAMVELGWEFCSETRGFRRGEMWVSLDQAEAALAAAEGGDEFRPEPQSETVASITAKVANV